EKVSGLEKIMMELAYESMKTDMALRDFKSEMSDFKDEMKGFKNEMSDFKDEMKVFKNEMSDFKDEMKQFKLDSEADRKQMNKQWGDLANKMGTIVEDIVAPGLKGVARKYFNIDEFDSFSVRNRRRNKDRTMIREFDVIAETDTLFFVVETKATPRTEYITDFIKLIPELPQWFPAIQGKILIPVFASLNLPDEAVRYLTKNKIIAMANRDDGMEIYNPEILAEFQ
ncbi:MAG: hypothetical protein LC657_16360, partial [Desulfobacteraceae bacterium]|nr:hypothetical protein [Desulfobacteraceae bacterium]